MQMNHNFKPATDQILPFLPDRPAPEVSDRYSFIDTRRVVEDMADLGYQVYNARFPRFRTQSGRFGLHEVDFRRPEDMDRNEGEAPRILFLNSYDGSRRAQMMTGIFRLICLNGLVAGSIYENEKFLHLGGEEYEDQLLEQIRESAGKGSGMLDDIDGYKSTRDLTRAERVHLADKALKIKGDLEGEGSMKVDPSHLLIPRRREDAKKDLWTSWNVIQENMMKGGLPAVTADGKTRTTRGISQISKSNALNTGLWDLLTDFSKEVA